MSKIFVANGTVLTMDNSEVIPNGAVLIEGNVIEKIGTYDSLVSQSKDAEFIDAQGKIIMPGLINAHTHLYSSLARGIRFKDEPPSNFIQILERIWWRVDKALTAEDIKYSALIGSIDCIKHGTTLIFDHHSSPNTVDGSLDIIESALKEVGIRGILSYEVSDRDNAKEGIEENRRFLNKCKSNSCELVSGIFGLHSSFTLSNGTLQKCVDVAKEFDVGFHIHVVEDEIDDKNSLEKYKSYVIDRLSDAGILNEKTIAAHCTQADEGDFDTILETKVNVVHNPQSNANNAVGCAPAIDMLNEGITVGLGSDGFTSNMFEELHFAHLIHKHIKSDPRIANQEIIDMAFGNNSKIATKLLGQPIGKLKPGALADLIIVDYIPPTPLDKMSLLGHIFHGIVRAPVLTTIVNGKVVMKDRKLLNIDEIEIYKKSTQLAKSLWERIK